MGSSTFLLLILLLAMAYTVSSDGDAPGPEASTESGPKVFDAKAGAGPKANGTITLFEFLGLKERSYGEDGKEKFEEVKCKDGQYCRTLQKSYDDKETSGKYSGSCRDIFTEKELEEKKKEWEEREKKHDKDEERRELNIKLVNLDTEIKFDHNKDEYDKSCESGVCKIWTIGGVKQPTCGSVKMQVTGYLFVLTVMVIFLQDLFGFFGSLGPESGLPMEQCCGKEKETPQQSEPEGTPKPSCGEWTTGPAEAPVAVI